MAEMTPIEAAKKLEGTSKWLDDKEDFGCGQDAMRYASSVLRKLAMLKIIESQPDADVVKVVHAEWALVAKGTGFNAIECTNCGWDILISKHITLGEWTRMNPYCNNCGAKMDGGEK